MRALAALAALLLATGCAPAKDTGRVEPGGEPSIGSSAPAAPKVAKIGEWAKAEDGVEFRVAKLARGRVSDVAAGGRPGGPAVIVSVQMHNAGSARFDMSLVQVSVRVGKDGQEADQVYQDGVDDSFDGTLNPGRTATVRQMYAGRTAADLRAVSVEITPGLDYDSFTFEGGL